VKLVENVNDIIEELNIQQAMPPALHEEVQHILLSADEEKILNELGPYPIHIDKLVRQVSFSAGKVSSLLLQLELKGLVTQSPGKLFTRVESKSI